MKVNKKFRGLFSIVMAVIMVLNMAPAAFAAETDPSTYKVGVMDSNYGITEVNVTEASEGEVITVTPTAADGYTVTQVGYCTVDSEGKQSKVVAVAADESGAYTFEMPASDVMVGAAFQDELTMTDNRIGGTKETDYTLYMANGEAFVNEGDESANAFLTIDKRFFDIEDVTMKLEVRQYSTGGYTVVGTKTYNYDQLQELAAKADSQTETTYTFENVEIPVAEGKSFNEGWAEYCVVQFSRPCWTDAVGAPVYRWTYTGDATVLGADVKAPSPIVWLYNLEENSYRGALIRNILAELNIPAGTVNNENLNQNIGYLVEWEGYKPVDDPYSSESYDVEYILMGNLTEVQLDEFINGMQENNIRVNLKSIPTAWTASKTFAELFDIMAEEDEVLKAAVALDEMIYTAEELDAETYGDSPYWAEFEQTLAEAIIALSTDAEETGEGAALYLNARDALLEVYLKVTGKEVLSGELELICEEQADGTYKVSAKLNGDHADATFDYSWKPTGTTEESIVLAADQLYKVNLEIKGTGNYYGELTAKLNVPGTPSFETKASADSIEVKLNAYDKVLNTPEISKYVVELYLNGQLVQSQETADAGTLTFNDLTEGSEYVVKVYAQNVIGRSDIIETVVVAEGEIEGDTEGDAEGDVEGTPEGGVNNGEDSSSEDTSKDEEADKEDEGKLEESEDESKDESKEESKEESDAEDADKLEESEKESETESEEESDVAKTGDNSNVLAWMLIMSAAAGSFVMIKRRSCVDAE